jgi:hypothetical protein
MGPAKREFERIESLYSIAQVVLVRAKAIEECEYHDGTFIDHDNDDALKTAYAMGTNMVKRGEVDGTREEFREAIASAYADAGLECPSCAEHRDE